MKHTMLESQSNEIDLANVNRINFEFFTLFEDIAVFENVSYLNKELYFFM